MSKTTETPVKAASRKLDDELQAMARMNKLILELPEDSIPRVMEWLWSRHMEFPVETIGVFAPEKSS
jgi:hypothetical protein